MAKTKVSEWSTTPSSNTDIDGINIAEGCAPSGINDAIRDMMAQIRSWQSGTYGDAFNGPVNGTIGATTASTGAFTTLSASSTVSGTGFSTYLASPPAIGGTAAAAGSFTTLAASSTVTLSGGTANGVAYLNGSKVVTSGSALTFDGSGKLALGNVSHTSFIPTTSLTLGNSGANAEIRMGQVDTSALISKWVYNATVGNAYGAIETYGQSNYIQFGASDFRWQVASSEQMRLTSTGLGIGTSSPAQKLTVNNTSGATTGGIRVYATDQAYARLAIENLNGQAYHLVAGTAGASNSGFGIYDATAGVNRLQLDSSGNLGLGVTPSAWSGYKAFEIGNAGSAVWSSGLTDIRLAANMYYNAGYKYAGTGVASRFELSSGGFYWYNAPSGTAGNAITFTQAMTLDANGQLGIGSTSPVAFVDVLKASYVDQYWRTGTVSMYLASSNSSAKGIFGTTTNHPLSFYTNGGEVARIDSSGNLLIGKTSTSTSSAGLQLVNFSGSAGSVSCVKTASGQYTAWGNYYSGTYVGGMEYTNTATSFPTSSDIRLKKDIVDAGFASQKIDQIRIVSHGWKHDDVVVEFGVIAQELNLIAPQAVTAGDNGEQVEKTWGVDYSKLVPMLIKAHQEQQAIIESLTTRLTALESKA